MPYPTAIPIGSHLRPSRAPSAGALLVGMACFACLLVLAGCGGSLSHRSVAEMSGTIPLGPEITRVRIEIQNGTVGIDSSTARDVAYAGGTRRAADTAADLAVLEQIPLGLSSAVDPLRPDTLVLRGPAIQKDQPQGVLGVELGIRLPATLQLEVAVEGSGHVTIANRAAPTRVTTGRGDLRFERCAGGVKAHTGRGMVIAFEHRGDVDIDTMVGDMQVFVREPGTLLRLVTGQGTVQCYVPPATGFEVDAVASIGKIGNGFGLTAEKVLDYGAALVGKHGDARTRIVLRTGSGHLSLGPKNFD